MTKRAFVLSGFNDSGADKLFPKSLPGQPNTMPAIPAGAFANYEAAGLVREATPEELTEPATAPAIDASDAPAEASAAGEASPSKRSRSA